MSFTLSKAVNPPCVFLVQWNQLRGRLDAEYNRALLSTRIESVYPSYKVRELAKSRTGGTPSKSNLGYWQGNIPWASPKDFGPFHLSDTEDHISEAAVADSATVVVPAGSLLVVFRSGVLQHSLPVTVTTCDTAINQDLKALIPSGGASAEYLGAYFVIFGKRLLPLITKSGATVQSINTAQFDELGIPVPGEEIQKEVARQLVSAFRRQAESEKKARELLATIDDVLLEELGITRQAEPPNTLESRIFQRSFSDITGKRFDPIANQEKRQRLEQSIYSARYPIFSLRRLVDLSKTLVDAIAEDESYVGLENISGESGDFIATTDKETVGTAIRFKAGQILFPKLRPYLNKTHLATFGGICSTEFHVFTPEGASGDYLAAFLRSRSIVGITSLLMTGNTLPRLQMSDIERLPIPVPPADVQKKVCVKINELRAEAHALREQARADFEKAKRDIEALILGKESSA